VASDETPLARANKTLSKFWQTPENQSIKGCNKEPINRDIEIGEMSRDFSKFLNEDISFNNDIDLDDNENEEIELLTEELLQVFNPDSINESTILQKENLLNRVLKLGGENYTYENLRRDIMSIEQEDYNQRSILKEKSNGKEAAGINGSVEVKNILTDKILSELVEEERILMEKEQHEDINSQNQLQLGICMNQEGIRTPRYGTSKAKRGRKSLKELRAVDGQAREQQKLSDIFNVGKGKVLPKAP
jgi:hypothetical protein